MAKAASKIEQVKSKAEQHLEELFDHLAAVEADLVREVPEFVGDVEGHLRVALAHVKAIVGERRQPGPAAEPPAPPAEAPSAPPAPPEAPSEPPAAAPAASPASGPAAGEAPSRSW